MLVVHPAEPATFDQDVRGPGALFLAIARAPTAAAWRNNNYWRRAHQDLYRGSNGVCVYSGSFTPRASGRAVDHASSIDHFVPKSHDPALAYEWSNFRLCRALLNQRKGDNRDVLDPVTLPGRWFVLDLVTFRIEPNDGLAEPNRRAVLDSIRRLCLNDDDDLVDERARVIFNFAAGRLPRADLISKFPYIDGELTAQQFEHVHLPRFAALLRDARVKKALQARGWV